MCTSKMLSITIAAAMLCGCERTSPGDGEMDRTQPRSTQPDNTARNERDRGGTTLTPTDQGQGEADVNITKQIRERIVAMDGASMNARNVKIITISGRVTLRGPVDSQAERERIATIAREVAGDGKVMDELEVIQP